MHNGYNDFCNYVKRAKKQTGGRGQMVLDARRATQVAVHVESEDGLRNVGTQIQASVQGTEASVDKFEDPQNFDIEDSGEDGILDPVGIQPQPDAYSFLDEHVEPPSHSSLSSRANDTDTLRSAASNTQVILTNVPAGALTSLIDAKK